MRIREEALAVRLSNELLMFSQDHHRLPGIENRAFKAALVEQLIESIRRVRYIAVIDTRPLCAGRQEPTSDMFDPIKAATLRKRENRFDEACWLVFLFVHFGKHHRTGWRLVRDIYGGLGAQSWDWITTSSNLQAFRNWLSSHQLTLMGRDGVSRHFGNHRKYESLDATSPQGTGAVVESYVQWVMNSGTHQSLFQESQHRTGGDARKAFSDLYGSMNAVTRFGRTARFDYLTMIGKLGLATIEPGSAFLVGATGPLRGARLLFGGSTTANINARNLDTRLVELDSLLSLGAYGMQVLEDALCNWQKRPDQFQAFRG